MKTIIRKTPVRRLLVLVLALVFISGMLMMVLAALQANNRKDPLAKLAYGQPAAVSVAFNNAVYLVTDTALTADQLGNTLGSVTRQVSPLPVKNGDIARNTAEGAALIGNGGGKIYAVAGYGSGRQIAVELSGGQFYRCEYLGKLP